MIELIVNQKRLSGGQRLPKKAVDQVCKEVAHQLSVKKAISVSVAFVSERQMKKLNKDYRGKDQVTDVLSFAFDQDKKGFIQKEDFFGEILLCYPQAVRQAKEAGHGTRKELQFLLVHGLLHLFGHEHQEPKNAKRMFKQQRAILEKLGITSPV